MSATGNFISDEELFRKYGKFCGYMAWQFVKKSGSYSDGVKKFRLDTEDAEDLASVARYYLLKLPQCYRDQPPYVKRVIVSKIITAWNKLVKSEQREFQPEHKPTRRNQAVTVLDYDEGDYFDRQPAPGDLSESTQVALDATRILALLPRLTPPERTVIELHFGLNGAKPCGSQRIATKLARSRYWVDIRIQSGLQELRRLISAA